MHFNEFIDKITKDRDLPDNFFSPNLSHVSDITKLKNSKKAIDVIQNYIDGKGSIVVYADVDIDGVTATTIAYQWLEAHGVNVVYKYHEKNFGHGVALNNVPICDLLIVVDSSSSITQKLTELLENGTAKDIIIIDHHEIDGTVTNNSNITLVNPFQVGCEYENKDISGALLTWRVFDYLERTYYETNISNSLMYLAAMSIVSDAVSVMNMENRYYFYAGNQFDTPAFQSIDSWQQKYSSNDLSFAINPKLNATIRDGRMQLVFDFLMSDDVTEAKSYWKEIGEIYEENKEKVKVAMKHMEIVFKNKNLLIALSSFNHLGYMASRVSSAYEKNVVLFARKPKVLRGVKAYVGSGRSLQNEELKGMLEKTGVISCFGHQQAFGASVPEIKFDTFIKELKNIEIPDPVYEFDILVDADNIDEGETMFVHYCNFLTGSGFPKIQYKIEDLLIKKFGETRSGNAYFNDMNGVRYAQHNNMWLKGFSVDESVDVLGSITIEDWFGKIQTVMMVEKMIESEDDDWE